MSHIDGFDHVLVGFFGGLPVYRPLEDIAGDRDTLVGEDFLCRTDQITIGGGSGEHPALVLERPGAAMAAFALEHEAFDIRGETRDRLKAWIAGEPVHRRYGWDEERRTRLEACCRSDAMVNPFWPGDHTLDDWLTLGLGEFCYAAMPELDPETAGQLKTFQTGSLVHARWNNILLPPPGLPVYARSGTAFEARLRHKVERSRSQARTIT